MSSFWRGLVIQWRVVGALIVREIYTHFGRDSLGFAWIVAAPLVFAIPVLFVWRAVRNPNEHGISLMPFLWSGYLPLLLFRHLGGAYRCSYVRTCRCSTISGSPFSTFFSRVLCWRSSRTSSRQCILCGVLRNRALDVPRDLPMFYLGYFYMIWWSVAVVLIVGALCERTDWVQQVWMPYSYLHMMFSGFLSRGLATTIPPQGSVVPALYSGVRDNSRRGLWHDDYDLWRPSLYHVRPRNLTLFGLWLMRDSRKYVVIE
jgi:capsular polysaccharide transport system permease protein